MTFCQFKNKHLSGKVTEISVFWQSL